MDRVAQFDTIVEMFEHLGIEVRRERLGGAGGGLCILRGRRVVFIDLDADLATQLDRCVQAAAAFPEVDQLYVAPALRERIEQVRRTE